MCDYLADGTFISKLTEKEYPVGHKTLFEFSVKNDIYVGVVKRWVGKIKIPIKVFATSF